MSKIIWTEEEIDFLKTAYKEGWRLKEMACFLKRSVTAVNKAMQRFAVRTSEARMERGSEDHAMTKEMLVKNAYSRKNNTFLCVSSEKKFLKSQNFQNLMEALISPCSPERVERTSAWGTVKEHQEKPCVSLKKENQFLLPICAYSAHRQKRKQNFKNSETFVPFQEVVKWLQQKGFVLEKAEEYSFALNQYGMRQVFYKIKLPCIFQPSLLALKTQVQIVILANKLRLKESLPLFHVSEVTQE